MKRYILIIAAVLTVIVGWANELNDQQLQLRMEVFKALKAAGYPTEIDDNDGDVYFDKDNIRYWVNVNEVWNDPYIITLYTVFPYDSSKDFTKENLEACISMVNQNKTVKLFCDELSYCLRTDIICKDTKLFMSSYETIIDEMRKSMDYINETITSGLGGLDMTGDKDAINDIALQLYFKEDYYKAFKLFSILAESGYAPAYSMLGLAYEYGDGVAKNETLMVEYYEKAIDNGESWCAYCLGNYYYQRMKYPKAMEYFTQSSASNNMYRSESYYMLGQMNEKGLGVAQNITKAIQCYKKSVEYASELECDARLALINLGEQIENPNEFVKISKAMLVGLTPDDMYNKGKEYENGLNNRALSLPKAFGYYKAAADKGHIKAILKMGEIYISKYYPFNDKTESDKYYAKAFKTLKRQEGINGEACYQLGLMYKDGLGVEKNSEVAINYFKTAASKNVPEANYELGLIYNSEDEQVDAFNCFYIAAENGLPQAMLEVAKAYDTGLGTPRNREQAIYWYTKCEKTHTSYSKEATAALKKMGRVEDEKE